MLADGLGEGAEDDALLGEGPAEGRRDAHGVEDGVHRHLALGLHARQHFPLAERNAELVEGLHQRGVDGVRPIFGALGRGPVDDVLEIDARQLDMPPVRRAHPLPFAERVEPELQQPLRLPLLGGDQPDNVFAESLGRIFLGDFGHEAFLVFLRGDILDQFVHLERTKILNL